ncbi:hypothetical protein B5X24_HaOG211942 [Helicoverpa armigera]|uniref:Uncharacterized protein n=1 Tax=Helicoverpa armigera TaxID=29058 RepID=A0A2W1BK95_HELAM|nr:hypothetical protein B5X24_HaOG211942 [Helicoverpa armigera]
MMRRRWSMNGSTKTISVNIRSFLENMRSRGRGVRAGGDVGATPCAPTCTPPVPPPAPHPCRQTTKSCWFAQSRRTLRAVRTRRTHAYHHTSD